MPEDVGAEIAKERVKVKPGQVFEPAKAEKKIEVVLEPLPPAVPPTPQEEPYYPPSIDYGPVPRVAPTTMKPIILDIETTGDSPFTSRIFAIAAKPAHPPGNVEVWIGEDDKKLVTDFLDWYIQNGFNQVIGFNVTFDLRFIGATCMRHRLFQYVDFFQSDFHELMYDLRQFYPRYIYTFNKPGKLNEWAKLVLDQEKTMSYEDLLKAYTAKDTAKITEYVANDAEIEWRLWNLFQTVTGRTV